MTELLTAPSTHEDDERVSTGELQAIFDAQNESEVDPAQNVAQQRELSPTASFIRMAAHRVAGALEGRALKKVQKAEQNEAFASYEDNVSTTRDRERAEKIDRIEQRIEAATEHLSATGRSALGRLQEAGLITIGLGYVAGEAAYKGAKSGAETAALAGMEAVDRVKSAAETAALKGLYAKDKAGEVISEGWDKAEAVAGKVGQSMEAGVDKAIEFGSDMKDRLIAKMDAAKARRQARRDRWSARFNAGKDKVTDKVERTKASVHATRAAGRAALTAFQDTRRTHREQNSLY